MVCFICAKSFRGRSRKIPCICGCDRLAHLSCVPGLSKEAAIKRKNGELLSFNCELCVTSVDPSVRQSPTVVLVGVDENCEVNQVVRDGLETPVAKRLKTGQDAHDTPPLPPWPSPSGTPNSSFLPPPPSQFETAESASVCVSNSPPLPPPPLQLAESGLFNAIVNDELHTSAYLPESGSFHANFWSPPGAWNVHVHSPVDSPEMCALPAVDSSPIEAAGQRLLAPRLLSFGTTLNLDEVQEVAPLASSSVATSPSHVHGLPVEDPLNRSEQPALPDDPTWKIESDASRKEKMLLTDQRGFR